MKDENMVFTTGFNYKENSYKNFKLMVHAIMQDVCDDLHNVKPEERQKVKEIIFSDFEGIEYPDMVRVPRDATRMVDAIEYVYQTGQEDKLK